MGGSVGSQLGNSMIKTGMAFGGEAPRTTPNINMQPVKSSAPSVYQPQYDQAPAQSPIPMPQQFVPQPQYQQPMYQPQYMNPYGMYGGFNPYSGGIMGLLGGMSGGGFGGGYGGGFGGGFGGGYNPYRFYF